MGLQSKRIHGIARDTVSLLLRDGDIRIAPGCSGELLRRELSALLHESLAATRAAREELEQSDELDPTDWSARWRAFLAGWRTDADLEAAIEKVVDWIAATSTVDRMLVSREVLRTKVASVFHDDPAIEVQADAKALKLKESVQDALLVMTPQLRQALELLQLSHSELIRQVELELEQNRLPESDETPEDISSEAVKNQIQQIVAAEDPTNPYLDPMIVVLLRAQGVEIDRRTVARYRELLGLLPPDKPKR